MTSMPSHSSAGYTLIELVVAMLLLGILSLAVANGVHFGARVWERSQDDTMAANRADTSQNVLRELLSQAMPRFRGEYVTFVGEPTTLTFDCVAPLAFAGNGLAHASLSVKQEQGDTQLVLRLSSVINTRLVKEAVLADGLGALRFSYLDASEKKPTWLAYWRDRDRLPDAIRITAGEGSATQWPQMIIRPVLSESADCEFDPVSLKCRRA
ncbi:MAG: prepilin-type N-terminal cleavage/methylation domain-containing protein [Rhizomicrobium sp.]